MINPILHHHIKFKSLYNTTFAITEIKNISGWHMLLKQVKNAGVNVTEGIEFRNCRTILEIGISKSEHKFAVPNRLHSNALNFN